MLRQILIQIIILSLVISPITLRAETTGGTNFDIEHDVIVEATSEEATIGGTFDMSIPTIETPALPLITTISICSSSEALISGQLNVEHTRIPTMPKNLSALFITGSNYEVTERPVSHPVF